ncbi:hypothetical protein GCM10023194_11460 [Planotetraspora phitsanulokensis]|uniref:Glycosyltransferase n=1 Tax=Planotetraspora phitsanulokensis TaxID=575192 RepID=A0A8J3UKS4_9ACTN|nr:glycosyltransferase family A protein [Planotetraspora phitsanulokensis]GII40530.1 hypothetical protein Pph01_55330 [Planotetraspora phitsanulokensis]
MAGIRIPLNDYGVLGDPPDPGAWTPTLTVSVIVSTRGRERTLPLTLAGLASQSYPRHLMEVIVVDAGDGPPISLSGRVPERIRVVRPEPGTPWTPGACDGDVVHLLDADLLVPPEHIEAHMRWHHLADHLVVLSRPLHVPGAHGGSLDAEALAAVEAGSVEGFAGRSGALERRQEWDGASDLREAGAKAFTAMGGAPASVPATLLRASGGIQPAQEYLELGYRLAQAGAVFVAERSARSVRVGGPVAGPDRSYLAERVPSMRRLRRRPGRTYLVPYVEAVVPAEGAAVQDVRATVDGLLASDLPDVVVIVAGLPRGGARMIRDAYAGETRVSFAGHVPDPELPVPFRFHCPPGWVPSRKTLESILAFAERRGLGVLSLALDEQEGVVSARLERTAAVNRARRLALPGDDLDDLVHETFATLWEAGETWGIVRREAPAPAPPQETGHDGRKREPARPIRTSLRRVLIPLLTRT